MQLLETADTGNRDRLLVEDVLALFILRGRQRQPVEQVAQRIRDLLLVLGDDDPHGIRIAQLVAYGERGFRKRILRGFAGERQVLVVNGDRFSAVTDNVHDLLREVRFERTVGERSLNKCNSRLVCHVFLLAPPAGGMVVMHGPRSCELLSIMVCPRARRTRK